MNCEKKKCKTTGFEFELHGGEEVYFITKSLRYLLHHWSFRHLTPTDKSDF